MPRVRVRPAGHRAASPRTLGERRRAVRGQLAASGGLGGVPMPAIYDMTQGSAADRYFHAMALHDGCETWGGDAWPCEVEALALDQDDAAAEFVDGNRAVYRFGSTLAYVEVGHGWLHVRVASTGSQRDIDTVCSAFRARYPASYLTASEDARVPITFWSMGPYGPVSRLRRLDAQPWDAIEGNYSGVVRDELSELMAWSDGPGRDGQLLIWQGPPGTGKTYALRALASEWGSWAEFHYITDPDAFFVEQALYMIDVLLADSYAGIDSADGQVYEEEKAEGKWRVLILEDTGELLSASAKEKYGQGLSRLLNVVDGMIGQGLRVLALVTTNDELDSLNPATVRAGRCLSRAEGAVGPTVFGPLDQDEATAWLRAHDREASATGPMTAADLFELVNAGQPAILEDDEALTVDSEPIVASAGPWPELAAEIAAVAARHQPDEPAYGQTAYDAEQRVVLWVGWDGTSVEEAAAAEAEFLALDGVDAFVWEAEALPSGWWSAEVVYPADPPRWVTTPPSEHSLDELVEMAAVPLPLAAPTTEEALPALVAAAHALGAIPVPEIPESHRLALTAAVEALGASHDRTVSGVVEALRALGESSRTTDLRGDALAMSALAVLQSFAERPEREIRMPDVHVSVPERELHVNVEPAQVAPAAPAPIHVFVPEAEPVAPPVVHVNVPEQPTPTVSLTVEPTPVTIEAAPLTVEVVQRPYVTVPVRDVHGEIVRVEHHPVDEE